MAFFHVDLWNVSVQEYLVLPGTDNVAAPREKRCKQDFHVPYSDVGGRKKNGNCFSQFYHYLLRFLVPQM